MNKEILNYTREELKGIIYSDSKKLKEMYPSYRWGQAVFNYIDQYIGVARKVQFEDHVDCFYNDDAVDAFVEKALDRIYDQTYWCNIANYPYLKDGASLGIQMKKLTREEIRNNFSDFRYLSTYDEPNIMREYVRYKDVIKLINRLQNDNN